MILSKTKNFLFIAVPKTGTQSIHHTLAEFIDKDVDTHIYIGNGEDRRTRKFNGHISYMDTMKNFPDNDFDNMFKFAFVRNPWTRFHSAAYYHFLEDNRRIYSKTKECFKEFMKLEGKDTKRPQHEILCDKNGKLAMDFVGRFENLQDDWKTVCKKLNIETSLKHLNGNTKINWKKDGAFDEELRNYVLTTYDRDFELFNYDRDPEKAY